MRRPGRLGRGLCAAGLCLALMSCSSGSELSATTADPATSASSSAGDPATGDAVGAPSASADSDDVFASAAVHRIAVTYDQGDYDTMIAAYTDTGDKGWLSVTVEIDGTTYRNVGMRLKGNSSLAGLGGRGPAGRPDGDGAAVRPGGGLSTASADSPEKLPWLLRLDKYVDGQSHGGHTDFVVRSNNSATSLNEAVALELIAQAGLASQRSFFAGFSVNGSDAVLRLVIENPGDAWMGRVFDDDGSLYKADASGDYSYRGDDASAYQDAWDQEGGEEDFAPLIEFLKFVNDADDETFAAELASRLDVGSFARYLALEELLGNFDDIDGPGNNSYLYYDPATERWTVVAWDHNLALGVGPGGKGPGGGGGFMPPDAGGGMDAPGPRGRSNVLVERFHAVAELEALYDAATTELTASLFSSGSARTVLERLSQTLTAGAADLVEPTTVASESASVAAAFPTA